MLPGPFRHWPQLVHASTRCVLCRWRRWYAHVAINWAKEFSEESGPLYRLWTLLRLVVETGEVVFDPTGRKHRLLSQVAQLRGLVRRCVDCRCSSPTPAR